ncbi:MAG: hypothetical protein RLZZ127_65 [Planctomycetota bacterium]|jgi:hypothetical protein
MTIENNDQLLAARSLGKTRPYGWNKVTGGSAYTLGRWYDFGMLNAMPVANAWPGTALAYQACNDAAGNGTQIFGIPHGGNVAPDVKILTFGRGWSMAATGVPGILSLIDILGYWPGINMNSSALQTLTGTPDLTRAPLGAGLRLALVVTTATGATAHNLSLSYTNQAGTTGRTLPVTVACQASAIAGHLTHSGNAANQYGPELPLANGDTGVRNVASVQLSAASGAGTAALILFRPLYAEIPLSVTGLPGAMDFINQVPAGPVIPDGACLQFLFGAGAATASATTFAGNLQFAWG